MISFILKPVFHNRFIPRFIKKIIDNSIGIIDPKFIRVLPDHIIYEYPTPLIMQWIIKEGDVVIDIGANVGVYTIFLSKLIGKTGKVYAFEPDPRSFLILRHKTKKIQKIIIENKAVSDKNGKLRLYLHESTEVTSAFDKNKSIFSIEVECKSLNEYFKDITKHIALIKMDVQVRNSQSYVEPRIY